MLATEPRGQGTAQKVCLATGGGRGIGAAVAREMHARGYALVLMSPSDRCKALAIELGGVAHRGVTHSADDLKAVVDWPCQPMAGSMPS